MAIENIFIGECELICLTETHKNADALSLSENLQKLCSIRGVYDKTGGGLMTLFKSSGDIKLRKRATVSRDILEVEGKIMKSSI